MRSFLSGTAFGYAADFLFGDPHRGHPVAAFGRVAGQLEGRLWRDHRAAGALHTVLSAGGTVAATAMLTHALRRSSLASTGLAATTTWTVLGGASLCREARLIGAALTAGDVDAARERLPHLCGRDPRALDADGIARAVVESVAENTSDAVVGALVWGAVAGAPGMAGFRAVNTLDAMVGHRSPRYRRFGWSAARLDDVAGWPGARLSALLATAMGPDRRAAAHAWRQDAGLHPSPNAGVVEAAFAGALGIQLGGTLAYGGRVEHRPVLNARGRRVRVSDIERAVLLSQQVGALALVVTLTGRAAVRAVGARTAGVRAGVRAG